MVEISQKAIGFIVAQEDGDESYYDRTEEHWDWPGGASGPTIGVGYDCGYVTLQECERDWAGIVSDGTLECIKDGIGKTGDRAHIFVVQNRTEVTVTWQQALQEFMQREIPKWEHRMRTALSNWDLLSPDSAGALLSLGYNRGTAGFNSNLPRFREMLNIHNYMARKEWALIPGEIRSMVRLWPNSSDLRRRRVLEAQLFAEGVAECGITQTSGSDSSSSSSAGSGTDRSSSPA